ncbi:bifunctional riboflavin kinase/FAD synthetase [Sphingorhabdus arenilitoris]|uniref:Riboflavin biosynthesis protein n=1 Tax=Sphingorhabdus arenilitoris TaxID=1490041 RepID=A0ABV8RCT6_9SPHN
MRRLHHGEPMPADLRGSVAALGNFDGFHLGHQAVAGAAITKAKAEGRPAIIATFDPHPVRHFVPDTPPFRLTSLDQRQRLFADAGADAMLIFDFGAPLAATSAEDFVTELLVRQLGIKTVVTGEDFTFGARRGGNVDVLREIGAGCGLDNIAIGPVQAGAEIISSSRIRDALKNGDPDGAAALLTRPFAVEGKVQHGDKNGRLLGYPTANVDMGQYLRPRYGIYAVKVRLPDGRVLDGAANIGIRPSFDPPKELLEAYIFDFNEDLYGQMIEVEFHAFIRGEAKFDDLDALKIQMAQDCDTARTLLR